MESDWKKEGVTVPDHVPKHPIRSSAAEYLAFAAATREYIEAGKDQQGKGYDPRKLLLPGFEAIKATVKEKMELFGSVNKA